MHEPRRRVPSGDLGNRTRDPVVDVTSLTKRYGDLEAVGDLTFTLGRGTVAVLESNDLHPGRSGHDHLRALALAAEVTSTRVDEVLELVELTSDGDRKVKTYSLGMRQRLALASALLGEPELLLLDEPANGLDPTGVRWLRGFLRSFAEGGRTVLVSSHILAEVAQLVDHVMIIDRGRLLAAGPLDELTGGGRSLEDVYIGLTARGAS